MQRAAAIARRRRHAAMLALAAAIALPNAHAQEPSTLTGIAGASRALQLPAGVRPLFDLPYGDDPRQRLDAYLPAHPNAAPIIVMVHGGAWMAGNKRMPQVVENKVAHWVEQGAVLVSVGYRLVPQVAPVDQAADIAQALARVQALAPTWGADANRIVLMGHSAGAHLVALLGAAPARPPLRPWLGTVVLDSAAIDLENLMRGRHARFYDTVFGHDGAAWHAASPTAALAAGAPPMLLVCSTRRADDSCGQSRRFAQRANALKVAATLSEQDLSHGEINSTLGLAGSETRAVDAFLASVGWTR